MPPQFVFESLLAFFVGGLSSRSSIFKSSSSGRISSSGAGGTGSPSLLAGIFSSVASVDSSFLSVSFVVESSFALSLSAFGFCFLFFFSFLGWLFSSFCFSLVFYRFFFSRLLLCWLVISFLLCGFFSLQLVLILTSYLLLSWQNLLPLCFHPERRRPFAVDCCLESVMWILLQFFSGASAVRFFC